MLMFMKYFAEPIFIHLLILDFLKESLITSECKSFHNHNKLTCYFTSSLELLFVLFSFTLCMTWSLVSSSFWLIICYHIFVGFINFLSLNYTGLKNYVYGGKWGLTWNEAVANLEQTCTLVVERWDSLTWLKLVYRTYA